MDLKSSLHYKEDQSPSNMKEKKIIYDREFLLALRNAPQSGKKPENIPDTVAQHEKGILAHKNRYIVSGKQQGFSRIINGEMGCSKAKAEETVPVLTPKPASSNISEPRDQKSTDEAPSQQEAKSIKRDDRKLFKNQTDVEVHASPTEHERIVKSTEKKKQLFEEEKKEVVRSEAKLKQCSPEGEANYKQEANHIESGKEILESKSRLEEQETKKLLELHKTQDEITRKSTFGDMPPIEEGDAPSQSSQQNYTEAKLRIRLTNGDTLTHAFGAKQPLSAVRLHIQINRTDSPGPFTLAIPFPRRALGPDDYDKPLDVLGLGPSAVLVVTEA